MIIKLTKKIKLFVYFIIFLYYPIVYFTVYLPIIVPRLQFWNHIPIWILILFFGIYSLIIIFIGFFSSQKIILINTIMLSMISELFSITMAILKMPGFLKNNVIEAYYSNEGYLTEISLEFSIYFVSILLLFEIGYLISYIIKRYCSKTKKTWNISSDTPKN